MIKSKEIVVRENHVYIPFEAKEKKKITLFFFCNDCTIGDDFILNSQVNQLPRGCSSTCSDKSSLLYNGVGGKILTKILGT